ncbi:MAG: hypothetical protein NC123_13740 [Butyrivibrio sp.]|nr:hypothetical protein [Acetatifactor muris]MCM1560584.1 hypothetical protein [Butyrivibrio sp.]
MEKEEILAEIKGADMVLVGLGEDFDDIMRLRACPEYLRGKELLQASEYSWLIPAWNEYCSAKLEDIVSPVLKKFAAVLEDKNYFVIATATDSRVAGAPWKKERLVMPCGSAGRKQCTGHCHAIEEVTAEEREQMNASFGELFEGRFPAAGMPELKKCSRCGADMVLNHIFAENYNEQGYLEQWQIYTKWLQGTLNRRLLVLELGAGMRFPSVIRWPFEKVAYFNNKAAFIRVNEKLYQLTEELSGKGYGIPENAIAWLERL